MRPKHGVGSLYEAAREKVVFNKPWLRPFASLEFASLEEARLELAQYPKLFFPSTTATPPGVSAHRTQLS